MFESPVTQHKFNRPGQVGSNFSLPYQAQEFTTKVKDGDLIILASDGLWDNLTYHQIIDHIKSEMLNINEEEVDEDVPGERCTCIPEFKDSFDISRSLARLAYNLSQ